MSKKDIYSYLKDKYSLTDFLPTKEIVDKEVTIEVNELYRPYSPQNPILSYLKFFNPKTIVNNVIPDPRYLAQKGHSNKIGASAETRRQILKFDEYRRGTEFLPIFYTYYGDCLLPAETYNFYYEPNRVSSLYCSFYLEKNLVCPILIGQEKFNLPEAYIYTVHHKDYQPILEFLTRTIGWNSFCDYLSFPEDLISIINDILSEKKSKEEVIIKPVEIDRSQYQMDDFWVWKYHEDEKSISPDLLDSFIRLNTAVSESSMSDWLKNGQDQIYFRDTEIFSSLDMLVWIKSGGKASISDTGRIIIEFRTEKSSDSEDDNYAEDFGGLFDHG